MSSFSEQVKRKIKTLKPSVVFTVASLHFQKENASKVRNILNKMVSSGDLKKAGRGLFYKEKRSILGALPPDYSGLIHDILFPGGKIKGYLTGMSIWCDMGLTTQFTGHKIIAHNERKKRILSLGHEKLIFQYQPIKITQKNFYLLQILDTIRDYDKIPDSSNYDAIKGVIGIIYNHVVKKRPEDISLMAKLAVDYPPKTRAITGAILDELGFSEIAYGLLKTLRPKSRYKIGEGIALLHNNEKWHLF